MEFCLDYNQKEIVSTIRHPFKLERKLKSCSLKRNSQRNRLPGFDSGLEFVQRLVVQLFERLVPLCIMGDNLRPPSLFIKTTGTLYRNISPRGFRKLPAIGPLLYREKRESRNEDMSVQLHCAKASIILQTEQSISNLGILDQIWIASTLFGFI